VNVVDVNDERPEFEPRSGCASVTEFHEPGELVTVLRAIDRDDPATPNGRLQFNIEEGNELGKHVMQFIPFFEFRSLLYFHLCDVRVGLLYIYILKSYN
jgi:hypothetical protein